MAISFEAKQRKNRKYDAKRDKAERRKYFRSRNQRPEIKAHNIAYHKEYRKRISQELTDVYIVKRIVEIAGLVTADITQEMIMLKREQVLLARFLEGKKNEEYERTQGIFS